jgi:hypothetical protein
VIFIHVSCSHNFNHFHHTFDIDKRKMRSGQIHSSGPMCLSLTEEPLSLSLSLSLSLRSLL